MCYRVTPSGRLRTTGLRACTTSISHSHYFSNRWFCEVKSQVCQVGPELTIIAGDLEVLILWQPRIQVWAPTPGFLSLQMDYSRLSLSSFSTSL